MLSDIEIAQSAQVQPIVNIARKLGIKEDDLEYYGKYKAKLSESLIKEKSTGKDGKLILVTAINPTPAGEGKTTTSVGLGDALSLIGKKTMIALREPSFWRKGRSSRRRLCTGYPNGGHKSAFYR